MLNRGVNGEETAQMLARFGADVIAAHPDLVLWQVGTNSVMRDHSLAAHGVLLREGIAQLKQAGADVVLMDMQYAPKVLAKSETPGMEDQLAITAKQENIDLFERFAIMRNWYEVRAPSVRDLRCSGPVAHERLGLWLRRQASRRRHRRSRHAAGRFRARAIRALKSVIPLRVPSARPR